MSTKFEAAIFNQQVRDALANGERHRNLSDDWADTHYVEVVANDEQQARIKLSAKYPEDAGYVIEQVIPAFDL